MNIFQYFYKIILATAIFFNPLHATSISGTSAIKHQATHYELQEGDTVTGFVRFADGFTISLGGHTHGVSASFDTCISCSGGFSLRNTNTLKLLGDLYLDSATTLTIGGKIYGYNRALVLGGDLTLAANQVMHLDGNLIIDGQGHDIFLNEHSQLMLDSNATVTIQNATIHNKRNNSGWPSIALTTTHSRLTLSDVELALDSDFYVNSGQLFIHNDVAVTGTSALVWHSIGPCTIEPNACLYFDIGTTFSYAPPTTDRNLIRMADKSSTLQLNGCSLLATHTGMRLIKGTVLLDNKVTLDSAATNKLNALSLITTQAYGTGGRFVSWSPDGKYLAVGEDFGGNKLTIYRFNGTSLTQVGEQITQTGIVKSACWSPDGKFLSVGTQYGSNNLIVYSFNGSSLTQLSSISYSSVVYTTAWSPDGKYIAIGGDSGTDTLMLFEFNGINLIQIGSSIPYGICVYYVAWSPNGKYLAVGGNNGTSDLTIYRFNGTTLTKIGNSINYATEVDYVGWSPDGQYLIVGGANSDADLNVYSFDGTALTLLDSKPYGNYCYSAPWSPSGRYIAAGGFNSTSDLSLYSFNGTSLTQIGSSISYGDGISSVAWSPDEKYLAVGGRYGDTDVSIYSCNYVNETATQATTNSILLGNNSQGSSDDINLTLFGNTRVGVNGILNFDNSTTRPTFGNRNACFVLQNSSSKIHLTPDSVLGWKDGSIIKAASGVGEGDYNLQEYTGADSIISYAEAPLSLVYTNSTVANYLSEQIVRSLIFRGGSSDEVTEYASHQLYSGNATPDELCYYRAGFTVADGITLTLDIAFPVAGNINLSNSGTLSLAGELDLGADAYLTSGGLLDGNGNTLSLTTSLVLPANKQLKITGNILIDGQTNNLVVEQGAKIVIDANVSVTLRNIKWFNGNSEPHLEMRAPSSQLTLDNVIIKFDRNFSFTQGRLFIYNDVAVTGTNKFSFASTLPMYIKPFSNLYFDQSTTFSYSPYPDRPHTANERELIRLCNETSVLMFNNCTIALPDYGMKLTKGTVLFDNKVTVNGNTAAPDKDHSFELGDGNNVNNDVAIKVLSGAWVDVNGYLYHHPAA